MFLCRATLILRDIKWAFLRHLNRARGENNIQHFEWKTFVQVEMFGPFLYLFMWLNIVDIQLWIILSDTLFLMCILF